MFKILLAVRVVRHGVVQSGYSRELELPFIPTVGMRFEQGMSTTLWETTTGEELDPAVERVIYDLDEEMFVCLFTTPLPLAATFWHDLPDRNDGSVCAVMQYFRHLPIAD
ncbi:hypothetical protein D3C76_887220 [compost metagenome]